MNLNTLSVSASLPKERSLPLSVVPMLLSIALWGAFLWMVGRVTLLPYVAAGSLTALFPVFCPTRKHRCLVGGVLLSFLAVLAYLFWRQISGGLALLVNRLFDLSAARQRYLYDKFAVSAISPIPAVLWSSALTAVCFGWLGAWKRALPGVLAVAFTAAACAYFGVTPGAPWLLALLALSGVSMLKQPNLRALLPLMLLAVVIAGLTLWLLPGENARISALDDQLRDTLAFTTVTQQAQPESTPTTTPETQPEQANKEPMLLQIRESMDTKTIILVVLIAVILLVLFVPAILRDQLQKRRDRNRAGMESANNAEAIRATFRYALLWLRASESDARMMPGYDAAYELWQEAAFSDHAMSDAQRDQMTAFQKTVSDTIQSRAGRRLKWKLRYRYAL